MLGMNFPSLAELLLFQVWKMLLGLREKFNRNILESLIFPILNCNNAACSEVSSDLYKRKLLFPIGNSSMDKDAITGLCKCRMITTELKVGDIWALFCWSVDKN